MKKLAILFLFIGLFFNGYGATEDNRIIEKWKFIGTKFDQGDPAGATMGNLLLGLANPQLEGLYFSFFKDKTYVEDYSKVDFPYDERPSCPFIHGEYKIYSDGMFIDKNQTKPVGKNKTYQIIKLEKDNLILKSEKGLIWQYVRDK